MERGHVSWKLLCRERAGSAADDRVRLRGTRRGRIVAGLGADPIEPGQFSHDGRLLVTRGENLGSRSEVAGVIWDVETGKELVRLNGHTSSIHAAAFGRDSRRVVTGAGLMSSDVPGATEDASVRVWNAADGKEIWRFDNGYYDVRHVAFSPDDSMVLAVASGGSAVVLDGKTGKRMSSLQAYDPGLHDEKQLDILSPASFNADGSRIVAIDFRKDGGNCAIICDPKTGRELATLKGHEGTLNSARFSPDGGSLVTASYDKTARIWDAQTGRQTPSATRP